MANIYEVDGRLIQTGRRLVDLAAIEMLNFAYATILDGLDSEQRRRVNAALEGRIGEGGGLVVDDPDLPQALQGQEAPSWWTDDHDAFANQHTIG